ncbi:MAG: hypothetical protein AAB861_04190 [Patescibacteria group bacterium]
MNNVLVANSKDLERRGFANSIIRFLTLPILNLIPEKALRKTAKSSSRDASNILDNVGTTHALEVMYTRHHRKLFSRGIMQGVADWYWHHVISQLKAIRNRLKIVEHNLETEVKNRINNGQKYISIFTVGGGSSRAIIHTISRLLKEHPETKITVTNLDKDPTVVELGKKIAESFNVSDSFKWVIDTASKIDLHIAENSIDVVEMVGLMDYFDNEKSIAICKKIYGTLKNRGLFIVANIYPNPEKKFVEKVGWPKMYYKMPDDFINILKEAGFKNEPQLVFEPLKVHIIGLVKK